jgi:predicted TIM-barrel fold metal-dependent hydrolase
MHSERVVDCHVHVFDPQRFPYRPDTFYAPAGQELGTPDRLRTVLDAHGVEHALLVGPNSGYGEDNRCLLDALDAGAGRYRGMAVVANATSRAEGVPGALPAPRPAPVHPGAGREFGPDRCM